MTNNYPNSAYYVRESNLMARVYGWMCLALTITAATAYYVSLSPAFHAVLYGPHSTLVTVGLFLAQIGLVIALTAMIQTMSYPTAILLFLVYAALLGITLSTIFIIFELPSIFATFLVTAGMFGAMAIYGYFTKADLSSMGSYLFMALIGMIIAGVVNMFLKSESFQLVISGIGVLIFTLFTAYDVQRIKAIMQEQLADRAMMSKVAIIGALSLYLDFVNLFLSLLQFMGKRKE
jgi:uncharacterized protein